MNKTVASVIDDIREWENPHGGYLYFVTAMFSDESVGSVGKKTKADAELVQRQLQDAIGEPLDFTLEDGGTSGAGRQKWKIKGFGVPGEEPTYTAPGVQGDGGTDHRGGSATSGYVSGRPPEHDVDASIRAAVALKAAVEYVAIEPRILGKVLDWAEEFDAWLQRKASEPASSAYTEGGGQEVASPRGSPEQAGAGSEESPQETRPLPADSAGLVDSGEGEAPESTPHIHDYQVRQGVRGFLVCACGKTTKKATE